MSATWVGLQSGGNLAKSKPGRFRPGASTCPAIEAIIHSRRRRSQCYLGNPPVQRLPSSLPTEPGTLWTRRDSNPYLAAGQADVLPLHHGPGLSLLIQIQAEQGCPSQRSDTCSNLGIGNG